MYFILNILLLICVLSTLIAGAFWADKPFEAAIVSVGFMIVWQLVYVVSGLRRIVFSLERKK